MERIVCRAVPCGKYMHGVPHFDADKTEKRRFVFANWANKPVPIEGEVWSGCVQREIKDGIFIFNHGVLRGIDGYGDFKFPALRFFKGDYGNGEHLMAVAPSGAYCEVSTLLPEKPVVGITYRGKVAKKLLDGNYSVDIMPLNKGKQTDVETLFFGSEQVTKGRTTYLLHPLSSEDLLYNVVAKYAVIEREYEEDRIFAYVAPLEEAIDLTPVTF